MTKKKATILAKTLNIAPLVVAAGSDFLFGEPFEVEVDDEGAENEKIQAKINDIIERNKLQGRFDESSQLFQAIGHTHFKLIGRGKEKGRETVVEEFPYSYWFPNWSGVSNGQETENVRIVVYLDRVNESGTTEKYVYVEDYFMEKQKAVIEYALFKEKAIGKIGGAVDLNLFS